jgi:OOP family OmpA-OmpF porin
MPMNPSRTPGALALALALAALFLQTAAPGTGFAQQAPAGAARDAGGKATLRSASLPARGLFEGDKLSAAAMQRLDALVMGAADLDVQVAFVVPSGPWLTEAGSAGERSLTPARLQALRDFLARRGIDARRIYVENRIDPKSSDAHLDVELVGRPAPQ